MIEHTIVAGKPATVCYLTFGWTPASSKEAADMVKVIYDDGGVAFALCKQKGNVDESSQTS